MAFEKINQLREMIVRQGVALNKIKREPDKEADRQNIMNDVEKMSKELELEEKQYVYVQIEQRIKNKLKEDREATIQMIKEKEKTNPIEKSIKLD